MQREFGSKKKWVLEIFYRFGGGEEEGKGFYGFRGEEIFLGKWMSLE